VLYSFCAQNNCADGGEPSAGLIFDQKGNLYGTTVEGGRYDGCGNGEGCGVVFKLTPKGKETALYSFCAQNNCTDGDGPIAGLVFDEKGNLYGTTYNGGAYDGCNSGVGCGAVFKLTPGGEETVLYSFCAQSNCADGDFPSAGMVFDEKGNMYGTTFWGGNGGDGVVFKLTPEGKETVLYNFCVQSRCADGQHPAAGLIFDKNGNLYGTTRYGGVDGDGVVFKLTPKGKETVLYSFCAQQNCADGADPLAGLVFDQKGNLYGTTYWGGTSYKDGGVVFKLTPKGKETVLYSFCAQQNCADGEQPYAGLVLDQKGNLYGTTSVGGAGQEGVVFKLTPKGKETVLHSFPECVTHCTDGEVPLAGVIFDQKGNLYGTTQQGGAYGGGIVFKLTP
jgi:uncharacterized repeat protein (TIGR03803 family)